MISPDALGPSTAGMWHDPNGIIYPYDDEDRRLLEAAAKRHADE